MWQYLSHYLITVHCHHLIIILGITSLWPVYCPLQVHPLTPVSSFHHALAATVLSYIQCTMLQNTHTHTHTHTAGDSGTSGSTSEEKLFSFSCLSLPSSYSKKEKQQNYTRLNKEKEDTIKAQALVLFQRGIKQEGVIKEAVHLSGNES